MATDLEVAKSLRAMAELLEARAAGGTIDLERLKRLADQLRGNLATIAMNIGNDWARS
jgi:hypothetical protein